MIKLSSKHFANPVSVNFKLLILYTGRGIDPIAWNCVSERNMLNTFLNTIIGYPCVWRTVYTRADRDGYQRILRRSIVRGNVNVNSDTRYNW